MKSNVIINICTNSITARGKEYKFNMDDHLAYVKIILESLPDSEKAVLGLINVENEIPKNQFSIDNEVLIKLKLI